MFLLAITKDGIAQNFQSVRIEEFNLHTSKVTIIADKFLSDFFTEPDGFSVIESPLINTPDFRNIIFSQVTYNDKSDTLSIFKSTNSGRPIYYHINPKGEFFCSTHISLLRSAGVPIEENTDVLPEFFVFRFIIPPETLYKNIYQLFSGDQIAIKLVNGKFKISNIKRYTPQKDIETKVIDTISQNTLNYLNKSVQALSSRKDRISVLLSGGLDSSILYKICQANYDINSTFSTGHPFEKLEDNLEKQYSLSAASILKTKHRYIETTSEEYLFGFLESIAKAEIPIHHLQSVLIYLLSRRIPENNNILISGLGADDIFGTSTQYSLFQINQKSLFKLLANHKILYFLKHLSPLNGGLESFINQLDYYNRSTIGLSDINNVVWSIGAYGSEDWASRYLNVSKKDIIRGRYNCIKFFENRSFYDIISLLLFFGSASATQAIWSKLGEFEKKIFFYPYTDLNLINYAFSVPWDIKLQKPKNILRFLARQIEVPEMIVNRPKSSFGIRPELWAEKDGAFESLVPLAAKVFDEKEIRKMQSSEPKKAMTYWNMLNYSIWKRLCIDNEPLGTLLEELG